MLAPEIGLVHQAHIQLLMVAAMNAEDDVAIDGFRMRCQILLAGGQLIPLRDKGTLASAGLVDPIEQREYRNNQKQHQVIQHGLLP